MSATLKRRYEGLVLGHEADEREDARGLIPRREAKYLDPPGAGRGQAHRQL